MKLIQTSATVALAAHLLSGCLADSKSMGPLSQGVIMDRRVADLGGGVKLPVRFVPGGAFPMGSPKIEKFHQDDETSHEVILSSNYWMGETEVTQAQWQALMGTTVKQMAFRIENPEPLPGVGADHPMCFVNWTDAVAFVKKLNELAILPSGWKWALPTEAQWERACRAGTQTAFYFGDSLSGSQANFDSRDPWEREGRYSGGTVRVGKFAPNAYGLYDMHGNVLEWCSDWYGAYPSAKVTDPQGPSTGTYHVARGGAWNVIELGCRSALRSYPPNSRHNYRNNLGFRVVVVPAER